MAFRLAPTAASEGFRLEAHDRSAPPTRVALDHARDAAIPGKLWVVSKKQESGRGRRGRVWVTPEGNLAATLLRHHRPASCALPRRSASSPDWRWPMRSTPWCRTGRIAIGLDGGEPGHRTVFELKWPNDVLASGAKLAGILLESAMLDGGRFAVAIGIGVNVVAHPDGFALSRDIACRAGRRHAMPKRCSWRCRDAWSDNAPAVGRRARACRHQAALAGARRRASAAMSRSALTATSCAACSRRIDEDCRFVIRDARAAS